MIRVLLLATAGAAALTAGAMAQTRDPVKIRATYERLCTGDGAGSVTACEALRRDMEAAGQPGTQGWIGLQVGAGDDGVTGAYVYSVAPDGAGAKAGLRVGDRLIAFEGQPIKDDKAYLAALKGAGVGRRVSLGVMRGGVVQEVAVTLIQRPSSDPRLNATRTDSRGYSLWNGVGVTVDPIRVGETFHGVLEGSDASSDWGKREDCLEIVEPGPGKNLRAWIDPNGSVMTIGIQRDACGPGVGSSWSIYQPKENTAFEMNLATATGHKTYLYISGAATAKPYRVLLREQTAKETAAWRVALHEKEIAAQAQRQAEAQAARDRGAMWSAGLQGLIIGATGGEMPAMREDGSMPNMLETLNTANAALERKNAEGAARLNATIAAAQAQGEQQRRQAAARERQEAEAGRVAQLAKQDQDRKTIAAVLGDSRAQWEQGLREAIASGDKTQQQYFIARLRENQQSAQENGVAVEVGQYAQAHPREKRQGQLGQTPLGPFPTPIQASADKPAPGAGPQDSPRVAEAKLKCFKGSATPTRPWTEEDCAPPPPAKRADAGGPNGTGGGSGGGGNGDPPGGGRKTPGAPGAPGGPAAPGQPGKPPPGQPLPPSGGKIDERIWWESVTLCRLDASNGQSKFGNWTCNGSLQMNYVNFEKPNWQYALQLTCGTDRPVRDLGTTSGYRAFGCGFPISPSGEGAGDADVPRRFGVSYVPGRISYRCPTGRSSCRPA
jgi:hypothetical protein